MSETVTKVDLDLESLIKSIRLGEIGLPDIQRPFVWKMLTCVIFLILCTEAIR